MGLLEKPPKVVLWLLMINYFELLILSSKFSLLYLRPKNISNFFGCSKKYGLGTQSHFSVNPILTATEQLMVGQGP